VSVDQREWVTAVVRLPKDLARDYMVMGTKLGEVKKTPLKYFANVRRGGLNAMDLEAADELVSVKLASEDDHAMVITAQGKSLRFSVRALRSASRQSGGVRGIRLAKGDRVVALEIARPDEAMPVVTAGVREADAGWDYPLQGRGGQGVITFKTTPKTGNLVSARLVNPSQELMLISTNGIVLRTAVEQISLQGRPTQGVTLMDVEEGETVAAVTVIDMARLQGRGAAADRRERGAGGRPRPEEGADLGAKAPPAAKGKGRREGRPAAQARPPAQGKPPPRGEEACLAREGAGEEARSRSHPARRRPAAQVAAQGPLRCRPSWSGCVR
jgi:DNA gyrase subunit A